MKPKKTHTNLFNGLIIQANLGEPAFVSDGSWAGDRDFSHGPTNFVTA